MEIIELKVLGDTGKSYTIAVKDGQATCSCPAFTYGGGAACKHMRFVAESIRAQVSA